MTSKHAAQLKVVHANNKRHGLTGTPLYFVWAKLFQRCYNKKNKYYKLYGGRGITVCDEWKDFSVFNQWAINNGYKPGLTIDREDNDGIYEPGNCRWVTQKVQCNNLRKNIVFVFNGESKTLSEWANSKLIYDRIYDRIFRQGWDFEKAYLTPVNEKFINKKFRKENNIA